MAGCGRRQRAFSGVSAATVRSPRLPRVAGVSCEPAGPQEECTIQFEHFERQSVSLRVGPRFTFFNNMQGLQSEAKKTTERCSLPLSTSRRFWRCYPASGEHVHQWRLSLGKDISHTFEKCDNLLPH